MPTPRRSSVVVLGLMLAALLLGADPAGAAEGDALSKVRSLARVIQEPDVTWKEKWTAYKAAMDAIEAAPEPLKAQAQEAYDGIRASVAEALRRSELPLSGWLMAFFGAGLLWGGLTFCIGVARKKGGSGGKGAA